MQPGNHLPVARFGIGHDVNRCNGILAVHLRGKCLILRLIIQYSKVVLRQYQHSRYFCCVSKRGARPAGTGLQPEHRKQFLKLTAQRYGILIEEAQFEESCICLEAVGHVHRFLAAGNVITLERLSIHVMALDRADGTRPCHIAGNAELFPFFITRLIAS